jgi:ATP-binding cassette, subfamily B, bacterial
VATTLGIGSATVLFLGVKQVQAGALTIGDLVLIMSYLAQLYEPLQTIGRQIAEQQGAMVSVGRAFSLLDEVPAVAERKRAISIPKCKGDLIFRNVRFAYRDEHTTLHDLSFHVPAQTCVGVLGPTGSGKTTLISLLIRFYDPTTGEIFLDGNDLRAYKLADLRNQFAIVLQEVMLFSNTIAANIAYARPEATMDDIVEAAKVANAHDFIMRLPNKYETVVGERGSLLSGGERQRISLARAFLKNAPILILDEPTSSVDIETEAQILNAMERLVQGRTTFIITHRPSALQYCDLLLRLERGHLTQKEDALALRAEWEHRLIERKRVLRRAGS